MQALAERNIKIKGKKVFTRTNLILYLMFMPCIIYFVVFHYTPMLGTVLAFADYRVSGFREWVGLENFKYIFDLPYFWQAFKNTWVFVIYNYIFAFPAPIILAILLNEIRVNRFKKVVQTVSTLPHFISWVVVAGMWITLLSPSTGYINYIIQALGGEPIYFLAKEDLFVSLFTGIRTWKSIGYNSIIFLAAIAGIDSEMYEAAVIDGANRFKQIIYITLPSIKQTILIIFVLSLSGVLNLFEPVYVFQNPMIINKAEVLDTYVYTVGVVKAKYSVALAVGLFKSTISFALVLLTNYLSKKLSDDGKSII